ncbi:kinase [Coniophora puteana RWD-64-598 SS2]|uniref:Kinase n=1 Tax=Coniophora puteana (strain RWD-64-598) TaxID=741705 RepID=A0A5M3N4W4_CONPW|nr:kinase [Coniophora puteana RWD-64-598 SS2]EIW86462.1 kinase [Coniophora puteana RWD-64-598 SS2]
MRRHQPTLFSLTEQEANEDEDADWDQPPVPTRSLSSNRLSIPPTIRRSTKTPRSQKPSPYAITPGAPQYSDIYSQFVRRYRSADPALDDDLHNDPDSNYFHRGLGQLTDAGDSDDEDPRPSILSDSIDGHPSHGLDLDAALPETAQERERLEWQTMLASVLDGDVLRSEKTRIAVALESSSEEQNNPHLNIWLGLRAKFAGRSEVEERKRLEERRIRIVDPVIQEINTFCLRDDEQDPTVALKRVNAILLRLDAAESLYPNLKAFYMDKAPAMHPTFQSRCDTLNTWSTVLLSLRRHIALLQRWTGSDTLDVTAPNTSNEVPITNFPMHPEANGSADKADSTTFVERVLKEDSIQKTFEKGFLTTVHAFIGAARDAQVNLALLFEEMNLPTFENELVPLISFPTKLAQAVLRVRLDYVQRLREPEVLIIDQVTEDLKLSLGLACTLKRQYEAFLSPDPGGKWALPRCISEDYDSTILEAISVFFRLIHWKLKSGVKGIYFKETDVLEAQWATLNDVSMTVVGGSAVVAEQVCALTNKLMVRVANYFETQVRVPFVTDSPIKHRHTSSFSSDSGDSMSEEQKVSWYSKVLDNVRLRYRKLQRFARALTQRFSNSAEYNLENIMLDSFISNLVASDHFLVYTQTYEEDGTYIVAPSYLRERPEAIRRILFESFHVNEIMTDDGLPVLENPDYDGSDEEGIGYLLVLSPRSQFLWNGLVLMLELPKLDLELKDNRVRLIAEGPQRRLALAKQQFTDIFLPIDEDEEALEPQLSALPCLIEQQAHLPAVNRELRKIARATNKLAESIVDSVSHVRNSLRDSEGYQELLENWFLFATEHGQHAQKYMERGALDKFDRLLIRLAISWVSFICDDCDPTDRKTFRWAVNALEFTLHRTRRNNILRMHDEQFEMLRQKVASCMTLLISHFDILGARSNLVAKKEKERQDELLREQASIRRAEEEPAIVPANEEELLKGVHLAYTDLDLRVYWDKISRAVSYLDSTRAEAGAEQRAVGRVLDDEKPEDRSLVFLASSSSNISIRWQQRRFIGAGAYGSVYLAVNLDSGSLMAVKEIKFQEASGITSLYAQIRDELSVMELLHHPNVVEYYGIEVHRDKVYIFEEYCQGGSLASLLEHGRIEDESIIQLYTMQMLEGLAYLHSKGIVHRDIKPDNILLDHRGVIKYVDFGASKILAKNRTLQKSRRAPEGPLGPAGQLGGGLGVNSLTGTPMYMSPEVIKNDKRGRHGAMDVWSLGCVVLEFATGKKPWSNLDNEWAIMFRIGVATQHPPLPEPGQLSELGISFIKQCLTIDPMLRPSAVELLDHPWMVEFGEQLLGYRDEQLVTSPPVEVPPEEDYELARVAHQAAIAQEKEVEAIQIPSPSMSSIGTPTPEGEE